jgi:hypothetical protein
MLGAVNVPGRAVNGARRLKAITVPKSRAILKQAITTTNSGYPAEPLTVALIPSRFLAHYEMYSRMYSS